MKLKVFLDKMKRFFLLSVIFLSFPRASTVRHSLQYFYTGSSGIKEFPEFVAVGMVDGEPFYYYDSILKKGSPKQDWMAKNEGPVQSRRKTQMCFDQEQIFKVNIETEFNHSGGIHIFQRMAGCELDNETGEISGFNQYGYNGEDFITFDLKTKTWIALKPQAVMTKHKWDRDKDHNHYLLYYLTEFCPESLKKYVNYGRTSLLRTELPSVSVLQKPSSSLVRCLATGFYPNRAEMFWRKDGEEIHEGVEKGEILPNNDGTFQMSVSLDLSSETPEDWMKYECVFQLSGVNEDVITRLEPKKPEKLEQAQKPEEPNDGNSTGLVIGVVMGLLVLVAAGVGVWYWKRQRDEPKRGNSSVSLPSVGSDGSKDSQEELLKNKAPM